MDNAAVRTSFASEVYESGVKAEKARVLASLPARLSNLHANGSVHIHDLEAFGGVYNCCTPNLARMLEAVEIASTTVPGMIWELFDAVKELITKLACEQSGGIGFGNFDIDLGEALARLGVECNTSNKTALDDAMKSFVRWANVTRTRFCREPYYITLNIGLGTGSWARAICSSLLDARASSPASQIRPNIVFKVSREVNATPDSANYDLFRKALQCTSKKMVPTYLLMDSAANSACDPLRLNIMGCRTRVYANVSGDEGTIGRGNVGCVSLNIPRIALQTRNMDGFWKELRARMEDCFEILDIRRDQLLDGKGACLGFVLGNGIWEGVSSVEELAEQGTYSVGFIGVAEAVDILAETECDTDGLGYRIVSEMATMVEERRSLLQRNYSLLASPGEMISGRFCDLDAKLYHHRIQEKKFYTNSFHVPVDEGAPMLEKIAAEAPFHSICNGGAISYIEFASAPIGNVEALEQALLFAEKAGASYMGFNFPMDACRVCGNTGTFDSCDECGSSDILRIRRVSGYLEDLSHFTSGKYAEASRRIANAMHANIDPKKRWRYRP